MNETYPVFDTVAERILFAERAKALAADPYVDMPSWVRDDPNSAFIGKKIVLCGSHMEAEMRHAIRRFEVVAIVDDFRCQRQGEMFGIPLISTDAWVSLAKQDSSVVSIICASTVQGYNHFIRRAAQFQLPFVTTLEYLRVLESHGNVVPGAGQTFVYGLPFFQQTVRSYEQLVERASCFEDEYSRQTYFNLLNYRLTGDPNTLARCAVVTNRDHFERNTYNTNRTFFEFTDSDVFVDGGAFDGDSLAQFVRATKGQFKRIYSFEPSTELAQKCRVRVHALQREYVTDIASLINVVPKGLWSSECKLTFNPTLFSAEENLYAGQLPLSGHLVEGGIASHMYSASDEAAANSSVAVTTIDAACAESPTFIKLEIEGSELEALKGASQTIERTRPKMAISIYHKPEDLLTLTDFVAQTGKGYRMSLLQHNPNVPDAIVLYCY